MAGRSRLEVPQAAEGQTAGSPRPFRLIAHSETHPNHVGCPLNRLKLSLRSTALAGVGLDLVAGAHTNSTCRHQPDELHYPCGLFRAGLVFFLAPHRSLQLLE